MKGRRSKLNCWEFKKCGRQPHGNNVDVLGLCPASVEERLDGMHDGVNAGRSCWVVAGTLCGGEEQGTFAKKYDDCTQCDFFKKVHKEEYPNIELSVTSQVKRKKETAKVF